MPNWNQILNEFKDEELKRVSSNEPIIDQVRRKHLRHLSEHTGRNAICYYSAWLSKPYDFGMDIMDEDRNAFMMAIHNLDRSKGLDLILHTPGGEIAAAESLVHYLRQMFGFDIRAIIPQLAMSAGTMIACSCKTILLSKHSNLGPIDPQIAGIPAAAVKEEFEKAISEIQKDQRRLAAWQFILGKYTPTYLAKCENAVLWAKEFVQRELKENMFREKEPDEAASLATKVVERLSDFTGNKSHSRHIHFDECKDMGLVVEMLEDDPKLQDKVLTVHHCFMHSLSNSTSLKIVENQDGVAFIKSQGS